MIQVLGVFGQLDFNMLWPVLALCGFETYESFISLIYKFFFCPRYSADTELVDMGPQLYFNFNVILVVVLCATVGLWFRIITYVNVCVLAVRQAAQRASKRVKMSSSDESDDDSEQDGSSSGSEFKLSGSDSVETDSPTEDSNASSDFNPFDTDTDSDAGTMDVWLGKI
jgi:hypothetical protein